MESEWILNSARRATYRVRRAMNMTRLVDTWLACLRFGNGGSDWNCGASNTCSNENASRQLRTRRTVSLRFTPAPKPCGGMHPTPRRRVSKLLETTVTPVQLDDVGRDSLEYLQIQESRVLGANCHASHAIQEKEVQAPFMHGYCSID